MGQQCMVAVWNSLSTKG